MDWIDLEVPLWQGSFERAEVCLCYCWRSKKYRVSKVNFFSRVVELIESYGVSYHQFADDTQLLVSKDSTNATPAIDRLAHFSAAVRLWFLQNGLQLNADKSAVVFPGTPAQLRSAANIITVDVAGSTLPVASKLRQSRATSSLPGWTTAMHS